MRSVRRGPVLAATLLAAPLLAALTGCGGTGGSGTDDRTLVVLAAASLSESFGELAEVFEDANPGVDVRLSLDSSATLAQQAVEGAPADVLATADLRTMRTAADAGALAAEAEVFATNAMVLVTPADADIGTTEFADIMGTTYVVCVESAPCGAISRELLDVNGIESDPASLEVDVKAVLTKVLLGEADAGMVYATDAAAAGDAVRTYEVPGAAGLLNDYPVAVLAEAPEPDLAHAWTELALSAEGQRVLARHGFGPARP